MPHSQSHTLNAIRYTPYLHTYIQSGQQLKGNLTIQFSNFIVKIEGGKISFSKDSKSQNDAATMLKLG